MLGERLPMLALTGLLVAAGGAGLASRAADRVTIVQRAPEHEEEPQGDATGAAETPEEQPTTFVVHVDGAVEAPGLVRMEGVDVRVYDAVEAAGGLLDDADTSSVNLAEPLTDGAKIHIPHEGEEQDEQTAASQPGQVTTSGATGTGTALALVNLNQATEEQLQTLPGVGEVTARTIVEDRTRNGPFATVEDLMRVSGIGEKKFEKLQGRICV